MRASAIRTWRRGEPIEPLAATLARGGVLAIPTESSYGLAADPRGRRGVASIFRIKRRPADRPLPVVAADRGQLLALGLAADDPALAWGLARWPAPLSVVVPLARGTDAAAAMGQGSLAVRIPAYEPLRELLAAVGPLTATSANRSGEAPCLEPASLATLLAGEDAIVVDGGVLPGGPPSTLVRFVRGVPEVLRAGAFAVGEPGTAADRRAEAADPHRKTSSGERVESQA